MAEKVIVPRRAEDWFEYRINEVTGKTELNFTLRALAFFETLTGGTNTVIEDVEEMPNNTDPALNARLELLNCKISEENSLTIDTSGFTVDTSYQFTDQSEVC